MPNDPEFIRTTEKPSRYRHLEKMSVRELLTSINHEDKKVPLAVEKAIPQIEKLVEAIVDNMLAGGRLFYVGAGTSGRLGILDASECPPTYGVEQGLVIGLIAGGDSAIRKAVEYAEDDRSQCWKDLQAYAIRKSDVVIGIAASGTTPYVLGGVSDCRANGIVTGGITCNIGSPLSKSVDFPVEAEAGPEFVTGSTRMKSGTVQKLILNMISTTVMIRLGRVEDNQMVNMQLTNSKLLDRGTRMVMEQLQISDYEQARSLLMQAGSVKKAVSGAGSGG
jgi:N-acetylmuramic acid 6-phosphate etherase